MQKAVKRINAPVLPRKRPRQTGAPTKLVAIDPLCANPVAASESSERSIGNPLAVVTLTADAILWVEMQRASTAAEWAAVATQKPLPLLLTQSLQAVSVILGRATSISWKHY